MPLSPPLPRTAVADLLHRALSFLDEGGPAGATATGWRLVILHPVRGRLRLGLVDVDDPFTALPHLAVAPSWWGVAVAGRRIREPAIPLVDVVSATTGLGLVDASRSGPLDVVQVVVRTGDAVAEHRLDGRTVTVHPGTAIDLHARLVHDHLRRALGLPTAPAPRTTHGLWVATWLDAVATELPFEHLTVARWRDLVVRHPVVRLAGLSGGDRSLRGWARQNLDLAADQLARSWDWPTLLAAARADRDLLGTTTAAAARWMDTGLYARMQLARLAAPETLLAALTELVPPATGGKLRESCRAWGIQP